MICSLSVIWTGKWHGAGRNFTLPATIWKTKMTVKHFVTRSRRYSSRSLSKWTTIPWIQRWWYFFEGSIGCIGILKQWLVRSLYRALREESPELTRAHLEQSVLPDAKWEAMRADAGSGEAELQYADGQNSYLSELANMPTFTSNHPILLLPRRRRPPIRSRRDISASHLPIEIKWEQCNRREKPPIVHSQDQSNWRQLVGWNRKSKKCNAQRAVR